ncbi:unnamed protein product [Zymoseptoria tritici ST99CH_3D7]|uniref:Extracellular membrane protein CFEM domain-containing protein n=1 Tax=Zymoseptoria tritici (strain ST99CH_3D7) TaxID=1276538 RepID=A0A1X7S1X8_ZYMT9|nr:unnamed protein product [Zymoseptoria tritici ST99CH_3D7]
MKNLIAALVFSAILPLALAMDRCTAPTCQNRQNAGEAMACQCDDASSGGWLKCNTNGYNKGLCSETGN